MALDRRRTLFAAAALAASGLSAAGCDATSGQPNGSPSPTTAPPTGAAATPPGPTPRESATGALPSEITHGPRTGNAVALTFHGQGDAALITELLGQLAGGNAHVTVMAVGSWLAANETLAHTMTGAGHELGNHTNNHLDIERLGDSQALAEITNCAAVLRRVTGSIGTWFRPSQTQHASTRIRALAASVGYPTCVSYDIDSLDYTDPSPATVVAHTLNSIQPGSIVSMHFGHRATITAMPQILAGLHTRGLRPVTVTELLSP